MKKNTINYSIFKLEVVFKIIFPLVSIGIIIFGSKNFFFSDDMENKLTISEYLLMLVSIFTLLPIAFTLIERQRNSRSEYIDKLVYKWHEILNKVVHDGNSVLNISYSDYSEFKKNDLPKSKRIERQFQQLIDMISLIYTEISDTFSIYNKKELITVWVNTFKGLFETELMRKLWTGELKETIDSDSRKFIDEIIYRIENNKSFEGFFKDVKNRNKYNCRICKDNKFISFVLGRSLIGATSHALSTIPCPYCKTNSPESYIHD